MVSDRAHACSDWRMMSESIRPVDPKRRFASLMRNAVDRISSDVRRELKRPLGEAVTNSEVAKHLGVSESTFSRMVNGRSPIDCDRLIEVLERARFSEHFIHGALQLASALNAGNEKTAHYFIQMFTHQFPADFALSDRVGAENFVFNTLKDQGVHLDEELRQALRKHLRHEVSREISSANSLSDVLLEVQSALPAEEGSKIGQMTLNTVEDTFERYSAALAVNFRDVADWEDNGVHQRFVAGRQMDFFHAYFERDSQQSHGPHPGIHIFVLMKGTGVFAQWRTDVARQSSSPASKQAVGDYSNGIKMCDVDRRVVVFNASEGHHGFKALDGDAELLVVTFSPRSLDVQTADRREESTRSSFQKRGKAVTGT